MPPGQVCGAKDLGLVIFLSPLWLSAHVSLPGEVLVLEMVTGEWAAETLQSGDGGLPWLVLPVGGGGLGRCPLGLHLWPTAPSRLSSSNPAQPRKEVEIINT